MYEIRFGLIPANDSRRDPGSVDDDNDRSTFMSAAPVDY